MRMSTEPEWTPAKIPGGVYEDYLTAGKMEDPFWKDKWDFEVKALLQDYGNILTVQLYSPNQWIRKAYAAAPTKGTEDAMRGFVHLRKAHCNFGWDWGPHMPNAGIWRPVELQAITYGKIDSVYITQNHKSGRVTLNLSPEFEFCDQPEAAAYEVSVTDPSGQTTCYLNNPKEITIENPSLWWPNNLGAQPLYTISLSMKKGEEIVDTWTRKIGLRTLTVKREKDQWGETFAFTVNGISFFSMGADYIPEDQLHGRVNLLACIPILRRQF